MTPEEDPSGRTAGGVPPEDGIGGEADPAPLLCSRLSGPFRTHAAPTPGAGTQTSQPEPAPLAGAALATAQACSRLLRRLIRAIIRLGLQDGAVGALPPLAQAGVGAGSPDRRLSARRSCSASGRFEKGRGARSGGGVGLFSIQPLSA